MTGKELVYLYIWTGNPDKARDIVYRRFPESEIKEFFHHEFRSKTFIEQLRAMASLRGRAVVFYFQSLSGSKYLQLLKCLHLLHRCNETILTDECGQWESIQLGVFLGLAPMLAWAAFRDAGILAFWWCYLNILKRYTVPARPILEEEIEIAYLIPNLANMGTGGGAISHIRGFLGGLRKNGKKCRVFCGSELAQEFFLNEIITPNRRQYLFWESEMLSYNSRFVREVSTRLDLSTPHLLYQRHCRFSVTGALLSKKLHIPFILEYNGSEVWIAEHWDPTPFRYWIKLCEEVSLRSASRIIVVSDVLKSELINRGITSERILVNPNAVDPDIFCSGGKRENTREELGVKSDEIVVGFVGTFSLWHGIEVLQQAIARLLSEHRNLHLRFILIGDGLLKEPMRAFLKEYEATKQVIFTGLQPHDKVVNYLDAADILVSPHIPMPDGSSFFGSPTKLFEYMSMGKAIIASRLDQLAQILEHNRTAWLVTSGSVEELIEGIIYLAANPQKSEELGRAARRDAIAKHSWARNAMLALQSTDTRTQIQGSYADEYA
jgi:glycosyltransferase involved in cell wall biosynthesis